MSRGRELNIQFLEARNVENIRSQHKFVKLNIKCYALCRYNEKKLLIYLEESKEKRAPSLIARHGEVGYITRENGTA